MLDRLQKLALFLLLPSTICAGSWFLTAYSYRVGDASSAPANLSLIRDLPAEVKLVKQQRPDEPILIFLYHPHCPCTMASVRNLQRIYETLPQKPSILSFAFCPASGSSTWSDSRITQALKSLGGQVVPDRGGAVCRKFGATTSGHVLLFGPKGDLRFSGGITPSRGHEGDCLASAGLVTAVVNECHQTSWPVFGCQIVSSMETAK